MLLMPSQACLPSQNPPTCHMDLHVPSIRHIVPGGHCSPRRPCDKVPSTLHHAHWPGRPIELEHGPVRMMRSRDEHGRAVAPHWQEPLSWGFGTLKPGSHLGPGPTARRVLSSQRPQELGPPEGALAAVLGPSSAEVTPPPPIPNKAGGFQSPPLLLTSSSSCIQSGSIGATTKRRHGNTNDRGSSCRHPYRFGGPACLEGAHTVTACRPSCIVSTPCPPRDAIPRPPPERGASRWHWTRTDEMAVIPPLCRSSLPPALVMQPPTPSHLV